MLKQMWAGLERRARIGLVAGAVVIIGACLAIGVWAYRPDYQVLFADLAPRDAASMTAELDKLKTPYRLAGDGTTIMVPQDQVYKLRLKLMGKDAPLYGAVGFEVFNNADLGMTEFVQKVNYQRAIQGELTRTIQSIEEVQSARVHLALPEQGLFKRAVAKAKASVTLALKSGKSLSPAQILGIQRLVASSVPDVQAEDVTVLDQHGVALTRTDVGDRGTASAGVQLDSKRSTEEYLQKKVDQILEQTFGAGQAVASVDVVLNLDQSKVTTEEVLPSTVGQSAQHGPAGVMVRERYSSQPGDAAHASGAAKGDGGDDIGLAEAEYQVGRRVEQLEVARGAVRRMTVAVLVRQSLSASQAAQLKDVIASAIGVSAQRGDAIVVQSMDQFVDAKGTPTPLAEPVATPAPSSQSPRPTGEARSTANISPTTIIGVLLVALIGISTLMLLRRRRRVSVRLPAVPTASPLSDTARVVMLQQMRDWIEHGTAERTGDMR